MNERIIALASIVLVACTSGCVGAARDAHDEHGGHHQGHEDAEEDAHGHHHEIPTDPVIVAAAARVRVLNDESLGCVTKVLGIVDVHEPVTNDEAALDILRRRAAALGADAVTGVEFRHGDGHEKTHMSGTAVVCEDLLRGRSYDVVDHLVVNAKMGGEDEAFDELKRRARALGSNLIIEVKFHHGESATEGVTISGTAVHAYEPSQPSSSR